MTTFFMATEEPSRGCKLTPSQQPAPEAVLYEKGVRHGAAAGCSGLLSRWAAQRGVSCASIRSDLSGLLFNEPVSWVVCGGALIIHRGPPAPPLPTTLQLGLKFPDEGASEELRVAHALDLSLYEEAALLRHDKDTFPLVIRLETVTDKGLKDGHTLQVGRGGGGFWGWALRAGPSTCTAQAVLDGG